MIKNSKAHPFTNDRSFYLYDRVRQDIFEERHSKEPAMIPSITTIFLLQFQASIIKRVTMMPQKQTDGTEPFLQAYAPSCLIRQIMRWLLLASLLILDNVARLLNVQDEMNQLSKKHSKEKYQHENEHDGDESETFFGSSTTVSSISSSSTSSSQKKARAHFIKHDKNNGSSGATHRSTTCTTPDPQTIYPSPPPSSPLVSSSSTSLHPPVRRVREKCISFPTTILSKQQQQISHEKSSAITKSTQQTGRHTRSISTSSTRSKRNSPKSSLYLSSSPTINQSRSTVLKETTAWVHKKQAHPYSTTSSAITSTSGSSCESVRQNIKNKRSSTETLHQRKEMIQRPYERCCQACLNSQHD